MHVILSGEVAILQEGADGVHRRSSPTSGRGTSSVTRSSSIESPRTASAIARQPTRTVGFFRPDLLQLIDSHPRIGAQDRDAALAAWPSVRLRQTNQLAARGPPPGCSRLEDSEGGVRRVSGRSAGDAEVSSDRGLTMGALSRTEAEAGCWPPSWRPSSALWLVYLLRGILAPFLLAFVLAYVLTPVVDRMEAQGAEAHAQHPDDLPGDTSPDAGLRDGHPRQEDDRRRWSISTPTSCARSASSRRSRSRDGRTSPSGLSGHDPLRVRAPTPSSSSIPADGKSSSWSPGQQREMRIEFAPRDVAET